MIKTKIPCNQSEKGGAKSENVFFYLFQLECMLKAKECTNEFHSSVIRTTFIPDLEWNFVGHKNSEMPHSNYLHLFQSQRGADDSKVCFFFHKW